MKKKILLLFCSLMSSLLVMSAPPRKEIRHKVKAGRQQVESTNSVARASGDYVMREFPTVGNVKGLVILAAFSDVSFSTDSASINTLLGKRYSGENYTEEVDFAEYSKLYNDTLSLRVSIPGSVRDYFRCQSSGKFVPSFDVVGPVMLDHPRAYYGTNNSLGNDKNAASMISEACKKAYSMELADFTDYDNDGDGVVDFVYIVYAGSDEAQTGIDECVWSHSSNISLTLGDMKIERYACSGELVVDLPVVGGIGTFVHEFSHVLGLPDFYNTRDEDFTIDAWSVMDYGVYNAEGFVPCSYTSFEKYSLGWLPMEELKDTMDVSLSTVEEVGKGYRAFVSDEDTASYYVFETIRKEGWNRYAPAEGLLITHVDYLKSAWANNRVNAGDYHRYYVVPANNRYSYKYLDGQLYGVDNHSFTLQSVPASVTLSGDMMNKPLTDIYYTEEGKVDFHFEDHSADEEEDEEEIIEETDVTYDYIINPYFEYSDWTSGWETTTGAINNQLNTNRCDGYYMTGYYWENWSAQPFTGKMYQTLHVPNGLYRLTMAAFATWEPQYDYLGETYMYANTSMTRVRNTENYSVNVIVTNETLEIGLGMPCFVQNWVGIDNVNLVYLGKSYDMYSDALKELVNLARDFQNSYYWLQQTAIEALEEALLNTEYVVFPNMKSIENAYNELSDAIAVAMTSYHKYTLLYNAWYNLGLAIDDCKNDSKKDEAQELYERVDLLYNAGEVSCEEIDILLGEISVMCDVLKVPDMSAASDENPIDVTGFINNAKYEEYNTDWTGNGWMMDVGYHNVEFYYENFYYYQTLTGLPDGMYKVDVQGYYRPGTTANSYNLYKKDDKTKLHAKLFAETADVKHSTYLQSIVSDASRTKLSYDDVKLSNGTYVPNTMGGAAEYFLKDLYHNYIYVYVTGGTLTIGLEKSGLISEDWTIFTNWSLTYYGTESQHADGDASGKYTIKYTVDGKSVYTQDIAPGMAVVPLEEIPEKEGHTFCGWSEIPEIMPASDVIVNGSFAVNKYLVTFKIGDMVIASDSLEYGAKIVPPVMPELEGHTFNWEGKVAESVPAADVTYVGSYTANVYKVYYFVGAALVYVVEVTYGEVIPEYVYEPTTEGDEFLGWIGDSYETMPAHDVTYRANIVNGIDAMSTDSNQQSVVIYDLSGRKVEVDDLRELKKGVYIVNGRKVIVND